MIFTMAISFLIFSASSFELMSTVIQKLAEQKIGADMYADSQRWSYLNEVPIAKFLD